MKHELIFIGGSKHGQIKMVDSETIDRGWGLAVLPKNEYKVLNPWEDAKQERYNFKKISNGIIKDEFFAAIKEGCSMTSIERQIKDATTKDQAYRLIKRMINNV